MNMINAEATDASTALTPGLINARLDRLPATRSIWAFVILLSLGGWFEFYDLFFTAYVGPGLVHSGILTPTTHSFLGFSGMASFVAATFAGLFIGTFFFASVSDKFGRRRIFTISLLWYTVATVIMAFQNHAAGLNFWRLVAGIGVGMEFVTIDSYVAELVPVHLRGRAFVINQMVQYSAVPAVALLAYLLVPTAPFGFAGWRWVVLIGAVGAVFVWLIRRGLPESPRWLAQHGRFAEADAILRQLEARVEAEYGAPLPPLGRIEEPASVQHGRFRELWQPPYRGRTIMLMVFNFFQTIGYYGFASWVPTLLIARGIEITHSLFYSFLIAVANPIGPLFAMPIADRIERKWMIVWASIGMAVFGMLFASSSRPVALVIFGLLITFSSNLLSCGFHSYQPELFPTRVRARAIGLVYSISRLSAMMSGFMVAYCLGHFGTTGVFTLIVGSMVIVCISIGGFGPRTRQARL